MATTVDKPKKKSYFTKAVVNRYALDEEFFIEHIPLDEGLFQAYQDITSKIKLDNNGDTEVDMRLGEQRRFLLDNLVSGWNLVDEDEKPVKFTPQKLRELPPHIISGLVGDIYKTNPILSGEGDAEGKDSTQPISKN